MVVGMENKLQSMKGKTYIRGFQFFKYKELHLTYTIDTEMWFLTSNLLHILWLQVDPLFYTFSRTSIHIKYSTSPCMYKERDMWIA